MGGELTNTSIPPSRNFGIYMWVQLLTRTSMSRSKKSSGSRQRMSDFVVGEREGDFSMVFRTAGPLLDTVSARRWLLYAFGEGHRRPKMRSSSSLGEAPASPCEAEYIAAYNSFVPQVVPRLSKSIFDGDPVVPNPERKKQSRRCCEEKIFVLRHEKRSWLYTEIKEVRKSINPTVVSVRRRDSEEDPVRDLVRMSRFMLLWSRILALTAEMAKKSWRASYRLINIEWPILFSGYFSKNWNKRLRRDSERTASGVGDAGSLRLTIEDMEVFVGTFAAFLRC
ncbi:hypothetical protein DFS33DRAFT_1389040 [Desarmillaria ectypa]|nr:hypothetical protein DFS33DRAFT_1389040 [Desarmillaria ectypa]